MENSFHDYAISNILEPTPPKHDCYIADKDDFNEASKDTFKALFFVTLAVGTLLSYNGYLMVKTNRVPKNVPLTMFLGCATTTILGKFYYLNLISIVLSVLFLDGFLNYSCCMFDIFMKLPTYPYVAMAFSYMMNWYSYLIFNLLIQCQSYFEGCEWRS